MANYNDEDPQTGSPVLGHWPTWTLWQYTSSGSIAGGSGACDMDVFNGTMASLVNTLVIGAVVITNQPANVTVAAGGTATFSVKATGWGALRYQWRFNQTNITGAVARTLTVRNAQAGNAGGYSVLITNSIGATVSDTAFLSVVSPLTNSPGCITAPSGLVDWWPGEGNPNDIFGSCNATPNNEFTYTAGKQGLAFQFDGTTSYLAVPGAASLSPPWTVGMWVKRQNAPGTGAALMGDGTYELKLEQYNGTHQVGLTQFGTGDYSFGYIVPAGVWTHLFFVGTSTGTSLYVNGILRSTLQTSMPLPRAYIGAGYVSSTGQLVDYMLGSLDEILLFNRALSATEIRNLYLAGGKGLVRAPEITGVTPSDNGQCQIHLRGQTGRNISIYASDDLENWSKLRTVTNPLGVTSLIDITATNSLKFYRASQP
jgi:hypothetical protein